MIAGKKHFIFIAVLCCLVAEVGVCNFAEGAGATMEITATVPLIAYNIAAANITDSSANITWMTNGLTNSTVEYGPTSDYTLLNTSPEMVASHSIILDNLSPGIEYHYHVVSTDSAGTIYTSNDFVFTTSGSKSLIASIGGGGSSSGSIIGSIAGMSVLDLPSISPELTISSGSLLPLTVDNLVSHPVVVISQDGSASLSIDAATKILDKDGQPVDRIGITRIPTQEVPAVQEGYGFAFTGYAYSIEPSGATFTPPLALKISLTPEEWVGISGKESSIQYYNPISGLWEALPTTTDPATYTATAMLPHASVFGLFVSPVHKQTFQDTIIPQKVIPQNGSAPRLTDRPPGIIVAQFMVIITALVALGSTGIYLCLRRKK